MLFKVEGKLENIYPIRYQNIYQIYNENEKKLEEILMSMIGIDIFPEYLIVGHERLGKPEADLFAVNSNGDLVLIELKVGGEYDVSKIYQAMKYAQEFSSWQYDKINSHFKKCFPSDPCNDLKEKFIQHYGKPINKSDFNQQQEIVVISNASDLSVTQVSDYWKSQGIHIKEYFYRFYKIGGEIILEISDHVISIPSGNCWINTCNTFDQSAYIDMVRNSIASAYGNRSSLIGAYLANSLIFLYHNGIGIIAGGRGTNEIMEICSDTSEASEIEKYIRLRDFIHGIDLDTGKINKYISAKDIKILLNRNFYFAQSIVPLSVDEAEKLYEQCKLTFNINT